MFFFFCEGLCPYLHVYMGLQMNTLIGYTYIRQKYGDAMDFKYYETLLSGLGSGVTVKRLIHGISWTAAVLSDGRCGVAMHTMGDTVARQEKTLIGLPADAAGRAVLSWNLEEASEALAVINAFYNCRNCGFLRPEARALDNLDLKGKRVGMIGRMIGHDNITKELLAPAAALWIMDREEKAGTYPDSACELFLPQCDVVIITGSAAINKTLPRLLELSRDAHVILTGPSVSCCPALLELGIARLNGRIITKPEPMLKAVTEKRTSVNAFSETFQLDRC